MMHAQFVDFPTPRNINYLWTTGGLLTFFLVVQIVTGIVLAMHYAPTRRPTPSTASSTSAAT